MSTTIETITHTIATPHQLRPAEAIVRLQAAETALREAQTWLKPEAVTFTWSETSGTVSGVAFGFPVAGDITATDDLVTIALRIPWTAKALAATFTPRVESELTKLLG